MGLDIRTLTTLWSRKQLDDTNHNFKQLKDNIGTVDENAVGSKQLQENSVGTVELKDGAVNDNKLEDGSITSPKIREKTIYEKHIADGQVTKDKVAAKSIDRYKLVDGEVVKEKIAKGAVTKDAIEDENISRLKLTEDLSGFNNFKTEVRYDSKNRPFEIAEKKGDVTVSRTNIEYDDEDRVIKTVEASVGKKVETKIVYHPDGRLSYTKNEVGD